MESIASLHLPVIVAGCSAGGVPALIVNEDIEDEDNLAGDKAMTVAD